MKLSITKKIIITLLFLTMENISICSSDKSCDVQDMLFQVRDTAIGKLSSVLSSVSVRYPSLFAHAPEKTLFFLSQLKARRIFLKAYRNVPAYKDFVDNNCPQGVPDSLENVPLMSKSNYIKKYTIEQTLLFGKLPLQGQIDTSTGTTGKPTKWVRGHQEMENVKAWIRVASKAALGDKPYIFCNMFALGTWATGMTSTYALTGSQLILSIGPDIDKLYDALKDIGPGQRYVIAGYPPHMKKFVENAPFDLRDYDITIVVGGEAMSENVYNSIKKSGIKEVYSSYGASDLRINIAQQTEFEQKLQLLCKENPQFKKELLGSLDGTPIFFHFNPLLDYIEETEDGSLLFTDLDESRVSPRVRYDLGDKGKVFKVSVVKDLLKKHGFELTPRTSLPILCLYGRGDDALTFNGANLMYDDLERALLKVPGLYEKINRYAFNKFENDKLDQQLEFWIELKKDIDIDDMHTSIEELNRQLMEALCEINQDFRAQVEFIKQNKDSDLPLPSTFVYVNGKSPMVEQGPHHKNKYVYNVVRK